MSYCRWSSDDFACDLYVYEDVNGGWTTHVANTRVLGDIPKSDMSFMSISMEAMSNKTPEWNTSVERFVAMQKAQQAFLETARRATIRLPYAGESFNSESLEALRELLLHLRETGYRFPDDVLTQIDEEIAQNAAR